MVRVNCIVASDFEWVFKTFAEETTMSSIDPSVLNQLMSRMYKLIRTDIPQRKRDYSFNTLVRASEDDNELSNLLGITPMEGDNVNLRYIYTFSELKTKLGLNQWQLRQLFKKTVEQSTFDMLGSDNKYVVYIKTGKGGNRKYSEECLIVLEKAKQGLPYRIDL